MDLVFVRTCNTYRSYCDYWKLVELSKYPICYVQQMDLSREVVYIISPANLELPTHIEKERVRLARCGLRKRAYLIWWNLERPDSGSGKLSELSGTMVANSMDDLLKYCDAVWVSDRYLQSLDPRAVHVVLGSHPGLAAIEYKRGFKYTWCHMSQINARRQEIYKNFPKKMIGLNAYGEERAKVLSSSMSIINVHQTPLPIMEPLRFALAAAYKLPVFSETILEPWPLENGKDFLSAPYGELSGKVMDWSDRVDLPAFANNLHERLCSEWIFRRGVDEGIVKTLDLVGRKM